MSIIYIQDLIDQSGTYQQRSSFTGCMKINGNFKNDINFSKLFPHSPSNSPNLFKDYILGAPGWLSS